MTRRTGQFSLRAAAALLVAALCIALAGCTPSTPRRVVEGAAGVLSEGAFYVPPNPVPQGGPGEVVRKEKLVSAPSGTVAWRIMYHSTDLFGHDILVSGVIIEPSGAAPAGGRTMVSWAHPTTGAAPKCAPSVGLDPFITIEGLSDLLGAGYAVAATDYAGMGVVGPDSYLIGTTEGNNVLDAARAAREVFGGSVSNRVLLWGHSQGGQAALFAAQDAPSYAPDLKVAAVAVAAPATDLGVLLHEDIGTVSGVSIASYAFNAYAKVYRPSTPGARLDTILTPAGAAAVPKMAALCLIGQNSALHALAGPLIGRFVSGDPRTAQPWASLLAQNTPGNVPISVPVFVAQGSNDTLVHPEATDQFVAHEKSLGMNVTYDVVAGADHGTIALAALPAVKAWFATIR